MANMDEAAAEVGRRCAGPCGKVKPVGYTAWRGPGSAFCSGCRSCPAAQREAKKGPAKPSAEAADAAERIVELKAHIACQEELLAAYKLQLARCRCGAAAECQEHAPPPPSHAVEDVAGWGAKRPADAAEADAARGALSSITNAQPSRRPSKRVRLPDAEPARGVSVRGMLVAGDWRCETDEASGVSRWVHPLLKKVAFASQPTLQKHGRWRVGRQLLTSIWDAWVKKNEALDREPTASELRRMLERVMASWGYPRAGSQMTLVCLRNFAARWSILNLRTRTACCMRLELCRRVPVK